MSFSRAERALVIDWWLTVDRTMLMLGDPYSFGGGQDTSGQATLSADGRWLTFQSDATDLVGGVNDTNKASDVFVRDLQSGQTQLGSARPDGKAFCVTENVGVGVPFAVSVKL